MRVLMLIRSDAPRVRGGDVVQIEKTVTALRLLGLKVDMRLMNEDNNFADYDLVHLFNIQTAEESWRACELAIANRKPVALSPIYWDPLPGWFNSAPAKRPVWRTLRRVLGYRLSFKVYHVWHHKRLQSNRMWQIQRQLLMSADVILPNSMTEASQLRRDFHLPPSISGRTRVVPNAVDRKLFEPKPQPSVKAREKFGSNGLVLQVGRISPEKNQLGLIEALEHTDVPLLFVGSASPYDPDYAQLCYRGGAERGRVFFEEWMPHERLPGVYALATVHALPSWRETPGLASLEAAASGCRVVSTCIGSAREYFGSKAWYCHPADRPSIRRAVENALSAPSTDDLRRHVLANFTWEKAAQATLEGYQLVVESLGNKA